MIIFQYSLARTVASALYVYLNLKVIFSFNFETLFLGHYDLHAGVFFGHYSTGINMSGLTLVPRLPNYPATAAKLKRLQTLYFSEARLSCCVFSARFYPCVFTFPSVCSQTHHTQAKTDSRTCTLKTLSVA